MPSKSKNVREAQKTQCEKAIVARRADLKKKGMVGPAITKDVKLKALLAKFRQIQRALVAIQAKEKKNEDLARRKVEKAEQAKLGMDEKKAKGGKQAAKQAEAPAGKKEKKEKKKA